MLDVFDIIFKNWSRPVMESQGYNIRKTGKGYTIIVNTLGISEEDLELYKTPHERLVELGFIGQEPFSGDYRLYKKGTFINIVIISFNIKDKDYVIWKQNDEVSIEEFYPVNLELAEILVDYLKEL